MEGQDKYQPSEFLKSTSNFLKGYSFKFEGLSEECERGFTHIVNDLGGTVSRKAKYTLVEKKYFEEEENKKRKDLYHLNFILDSLDFKNVLDIESYRCDKSAYSKSLEKSPSILQKKRSSYLNGDSRNTTARNHFSNVINSDDFEPNFQTKNGNQNSGKTTVRNNISNVTNSDDDITLRNKSNNNSSFNNINTTVRNNLSNVTNSDDDDTIVQNKSSNNSNRNNGNAVRNNSSNESNSEEDIAEDEMPILQRLKQAESSTKQSNVEALKNNISKNKKRKLNVLSDSGSNSSDKSVKIKSEPKSSDSSELSGSSDSDENKTLSQNKKGHIKKEVVTSSNDDSANSETDSEPSVPKRIKKEVVSRKKTNSKTWVDTKDVENSKTKKTNTKVKKLPSRREVVWPSSKIEGREDLKFLFEFDMDDLCQIKRCTFEPGLHESHGYPGRIISDEEKKVMLKYLIRNKMIHRAKGIRTWEIMAANGYLTHRSADTLRNCLRRVILPNIHKFELPQDILDQFLLLEEKKAKGKKIWS